ncbi:MAG: homoserine dehydrogenase [Actinobacteria bacterium]|uniref:Homoserine dehydrogenase n=1 Tax=freshwater metagenome TaxID=449393 RepID=A0A6J7R1D2_9ZZZZ|nr:homoserine dehydrogenase [Actinomycetota bacterium]MSW21892.1 homoserine dehydrogenase [Actinomycetota bacterium]MSX03703.1 homoserine dehydrogenase [Actinomycetota bacterium]MSX60896.1 homoserine dehydrogenase [Actinomycetota bacterium]MSX84042.1 homoserine dehydrogenase [Actinomycetota bacterium]
MNSQKTLRVGMLGCGVVGSEVARLIVANQSDLTARSGAKLELVKIGVRNLTRPSIAKELLTTDLESIVKDTNIDLIIEVIGGIEPAKSLILEALKNGKSVVTANKALLAKHGGELFTAADKSGVDLYYEASVAGAIPILRPLRESLVGDHVQRVMGIVNGTTNFILTKMDESGAAFADALAEAQALGFAEADPTADVEGFDAAAKAAILAGLAFHSRVTDADVFREGITNITDTDVAVAKSLNLVVKLLAIAELTSDGKISVRVHPTLISRSHPLAAVREAFNAVFVESESAGAMMFYGRGAGGAPTASAILGDLVAVARHRVSGGLGPRESDYADLDIAPMGSTKTRYLIRLEVADLPGVLAAVAQTFAKHEVSIQTVRQTGRNDAAELIVMTHKATDSALAATVAELQSLGAVKDIASVIRVEGMGA